jgi:hypothetical protein
VIVASRVVILAIASSFSGELSVAASLAVT